jgi:hypothetical protein
MTGSGLGTEEVGRIIHADSQDHPAAGDKGLIEKAFEIGCRLLWMFPLQTVSAIAAESNYFRFIRLKHPS